MPKSLPVGAERGNPSAAMIAAITATHGATLATRNARDFEGCGVDVPDLWGG